MASKNTGLEDNIEVSMLVTGKLLKNMSLVELLDGICDFGPIHLPVSFFHTPNSPGYNSYMRPEFKLDKNCQKNVDGYN